MASRQREWQKKQRRNGNCVECGKPADGERCEYHKQKRHETYLRRKQRRLIQE